MLQSLSVSKLRMKALVLCAALLVFTVVPTNASASTYSSEAITITSPQRGSTVQEGTVFSVSIKNPLAGRKIVRVRYILRYVGYTSFIDNIVGEATAATNFALSYSEPVSYHQGYGDAWVYVEGFDSNGRRVATAGDTTIGGVQMRNYVYVEDHRCAYACALPR